MKGRGLAIALMMGVGGCAATTSGAQEVPPAAEPAVAAPIDQPLSLLSPGVALLIGVINVAWNLHNSRATRKIGKQAQRTARKMGALNPFRQDAVARLKEIQSITGELTGLPQSSDYKTAFKPVQQRFVGGFSQLNHVLLMMEFDPEIDGSDWSTCCDDAYDRYLECCNDLLDAGATNDAHARSAVRLQEIAAEIQRAVLLKFSTAITSAH